MDIKATRHTSTNLEEINERIEQILKDASQYENDKSIDLNTLTLPELKAFAEAGNTWKTFPLCPYDSTNRLSFLISFSSLSIRWTRCLCFQN
jgi:hypothetical protein